MESFGKISTLKIGKTLLINCQLVIWETTGLVNAFEFNPGADKRLAEIVGSAADGKQVYLDFRHIGIFASRTVYDLQDIAQRCGAKGVTFVATGVALRTHLLRFTTSYREIDGTLYYNGQPVAWAEELPEGIAAEERRYVKETVTGAFRFHRRAGGKYELKPLPSSMMFTNGIFDAGKIIKDAKQFAWTSLLLSRLVRRQIWNLDRQAVEGAGQSRKVRLVSASLRGGVFASAVAGLTALQLDFVCIDHFGPISRLIEQPRTITDSPEPCDAIMIADIVSGGTELKMTYNFLEWHQWRLTGVVAINTLWRQEFYHFSPAADGLASLFVLFDLIPDLEVKLPHDQSADPRR